MSLLLEEIFLSGSCKGLCKNQDFIFTSTGELSTGEEFKFGILLDGHGNDSFIIFMRSLDWQSILSSDDNFTNVWLKFKSFLDLYKGKILEMLDSGSTLIMVRMFSNRIESLSLGDSRVIIYKNNTFIYGSTPHNLKNPLEVERLKTHDHIVITESYLVPEIRNSKAVQSRKCLYIMFSYGVKLALTQSIGHCGVTGYEPEFHTEFFTESDKIRVILGSDGFFDMILLSDSFPNSEITIEDQEDLINDENDLLTMSDEQLLEKAEMRWRKEDWIYHYDLNDYNRTTQIGFGGSYDDISVIVFDKK